MCQRSNTKLELGRPLRCYKVVQRYKDTYQSIHYPYIWNTSENHCSSCPILKRNKYGSIEIGSGFFHAFPTLTSLKKVYPSFLPHNYCIIELEIPVGTLCYKGKCMINLTIIDSIAATKMKFIREICV